MQPWITKEDGFQMTGDVHLKFEATSDIDGKVNIPFCYLTGKWKPNISFFGVEKCAGELPNIILIKVDGAVINSVVLKDGKGCALGNYSKIKAQEGCMELCLVDGTAKQNPLPGISVRVNFSLDKDMVDKCTE
jgi:hypothetical protein